MDLLIQRLNSEIQAYQDITELIQKMFNASHEDQCYKLTVLKEVCIFNVFSLVTLTF